MILERIDEHAWDGTSTGRHGAFGASTPWYKSKLIRGRGTNGTAVPGSFQADSGNCRGQDTSKTA